MAHIKLHLKPKNKHIHTITRISTCICISLATDSSIIIAVADGVWQHLAASGVPVAAQIADFRPSKKNSQYVCLYIPHLKPDCVMWLVMAVTLSRRLISSKSIQFNKSMRFMILTSALMKWLKDWLHKQKYYNFINSTGSEKCLVVLEVITFYDAAI